EVHTGLVFLDQKTSVRDTTGTKTRHAVEYKGKQITPFAYESVSVCWFENNHFAYARRFSDLPTGGVGKWDIVPFEGPIRPTPFSRITYQPVRAPDGTITNLCLGIEDTSEVEKRITLIDRKGIPRSTFFAKVGKTILRPHGQVMVLDSVDEQGNAFSSVHDATGLPITPKMAEFLHSRYAYPSEPEPPLFLRKSEREGLWTLLGNRSSAVVGRLPESFAKNGMERRIVRPLRDDGKFVTLPKGSIGMMPLALDAYSADNIPAHTHWAVVFVEANGFRFAVGTGDPERVCELAGENKLPVYESLEPLFWRTDRGQETPGMTVYAAKPVGGAWQLVRASNWTTMLVPFAGESASYGSSLEVREAWIRGVRETRRLAEVKRVAEEVERRKKEAALAELKAAALRQQFEASFQAKYPGVGIVILHQIGTQEMWTRYIERFQAADLLDENDLRVAASKGVSPTLLASARVHVQDHKRRMDEYKAAFAERLARQIKEDAERMREEARWIITDWPSSVGGNSSAGMTYLNKIGYESMVKQNTQAWSSGANPWGQAWGPK
ncbi:MAG: hypothetical protein KBF88_06955, partial [Polyangiaceae bacterium]|nr:hypothetical protein [Polyangiaceae bacterium]